LPNEKNSGERWFVKREHTLLSTSSEYWFEALKLIFAADVFCGGAGEIFFSIYADSTSNDGRFKVFGRGSGTNGLCE